MKILNLYAGIGGNKKLWGDKYEITAIEINPKIAKIYQDFFPNDKVIVCDAHEYLREHFKEFDFIWSSPPCPTHSKFMISHKTRDSWKMPFPDMKLYEEIIFLKSWFKGMWVVENVMSYYKPLIKPFEVQRHFFWSNFPIPQDSFIEPDHIRETTINDLQEHHNFNLDSYCGIDKSKVLSNCVTPKLGLHVFKCAFKDKQEVLE